MMPVTDEHSRPAVHSVHEAAREALALGLCPVPTALDGSKRPHGEWKQFQASRPTSEQVDAWFANGHPGWGVICGAVSGGMEMLELEGRAVSEGMWEMFGERCDEAGIGLLLDRIATHGYAEVTPGNGIHLLFQVDGVAKGNLKLARRPDGNEVQVLFETRGEGGFVVLAPSGGPVHPSGRPWELVQGSLASIAIISEAERDALYDVARSFDAMPERVIQMPRHVELAPYRTTHADSWMDELCTNLARTPWGDILGRYGYQHHHDAGEVSYWTRPGKAGKEGHSATTNAKGTDRLIMFSTGTPLEEWDGTGPAPSYDRLDVIAAYEHQGDRMAAGRALAPARTTSRPTPPANINPITGEISTTHLPEDFWGARPMLAHIRQAAHSRVRSADAYLGAVLARLAALTHPSIRLPPIVGAPAPLSLYVAQVGRSGGGKSSTVSGATELLPYDGLEVADNMPLGSGEGLIELYYDLVDEVGTDGKTRKVKRQTRWGAFVYLDEGQALAELGNRKGSTLMPMLRTAWSGMVLGTSNASAETKRKLNAGAYTLGMVIAFQPSKAADLLADATGGTPQRFEWVQDVDPTVPDIPPPWPGPLDWHHPTLLGYGSVTNPRLMGMPERIVDLIRNQAVQLTRGALQRDELDSHATLAQMKVAGLFAVLDGRTDIAEEDWALAGTFQRVSHSVRAQVLAAVAIEQRHAKEASIALHVSREGAVVDDQVDRAVWRMAKGIGRHVHRNGCAGCSRRCVSQACAGRDRALGTIDQAIEKAVEMKWISVEGDLFQPGEAMPT